MSRDDVKRALARAALAELPAEGVIGLGTGSTTRFFLEELGRAIAGGARYLGVPTSETCRRDAAALGIPLLGDDGPWDIDVCVDGADEVDPRLDLIKGGGGAHTREKLVNGCARRNVIVIDDSKLSSQLGMRCAIPVEVLRFGHRATGQQLDRLGPATLRHHDGVLWYSDGGNPIYDVTTGPLEDAAALDAALHAIPGVVETGLFIERVNLVLVGRDTGIERLARTPSRRPT